VAELQPIPANSVEAKETLSGIIAGRFMIVGRLGKGGMGEVYRAEDAKLRRTVALKRLAPQLRADPIYRRRFQEEATRVSRFSDSQIASVYDVFEDQGEIFLVMEYVEGQTLRERLRQPMSLDQFLDIATQCTKALIAAHERSIVHCDIKPENIMLTTSGQVKILDFGVAKHLPRSDQSSTVDRGGGFGGTPAYMSPEVLLEKVPDGRADIFSLGVVFYEALTCQHPFLAGSFVATSDRIRHETPASIRIFNPKVPEQLEALVKKAMSKERGQRHASARELLQDLHAVQTGITPSGFSRFLPRPGELKPKRSVFAAIVAVLAGIVATLVVFTVIAVYRNGHRTPPILQERGWVLISDFGTHGDESLPDTGVREGLTIALQQSRYVNVFPRTRVYDVLLRMKRGDVTRIDENLGREICQREDLQILLTGSIEHIGQVFQITVQAVDPIKGNLLFAERERFDRKEQFFEKADELAKKVRKDLGESHLGIERTSRPLAKVTTRSLEALQLYSRASDAMAQGDTDQAPALLQSALKFDPDFAMAHLLLGEHYSWVVGKNERALAELQRAYDLKQAVSDREQRRIEAEYYTHHEQYEEAAQSLSVLVSLYPDDAEAHEKLAGAHYNLGQVGQAVVELRKVLRLDPFSAIAYRNLVLYLARNNADAEAIAAFREAHQQGIHSPQLHWGLGLALLGQDKVSAAREEFRRIGKGSVTDLDLQELYFAIADLYEGQLGAASAALSSRVESTGAPSSGLQFVRRYLLGRIALIQGKPRVAVFEADSILHAPDADLLTSDLLSAGTLYALAGETTKARQVLRRLDNSLGSIASSWNKSSFHNLEGEIFLAEKKVKQAEAAFLAAAAEYPQVFSHIGLARTYEAQRRWDFAAGDWEAVLRARGEILQNGFPPDLVLAHLELARAYRNLGDRDRARTHYDEVLRLWQRAEGLSWFREARREAQELTLESKPRTEGTLVIPPQFK